MITSLTECDSHLAGLWPKLPPAMRPHASKLREQIKRYHENPEGLRPLIRLARPLRR